MAILPVDIVPCVFQLLASAASPASPASPVSLFEKFLKPPMFQNAADDPRLPGGSFISNFPSHVAAAHHGVGQVEDGFAAAHLLGGCDETSQNEAL